MNKINELPKDIPLTTHEWILDLQGSVTNKRYVGEFTCKIPNIKEQCLIERHNANLNGEMAAFLPQGVLKMNKMIAYLRYTLTEYPKFWKESDLGYELRDPNVVEAVYDEVIKFEENWYLTIWGKKEDEPNDEQESEEKEAEKGSVSKD